MASTGGGDDEDDMTAQGPVALPRTSHLFLALHAPTEFDDEEDVECRVGTTLYAVRRSQQASSTPPYKNQDDTPASSHRHPPVPLDVIGPLLIACKTRDAVLAKNLTFMRLIVGEQPAGEPKSWRKRRCDAIDKYCSNATTSLSSFADPEPFLETAFTDGSIQALLCAALLLVEIPPGKVITLGTVASKVLHDTSMPSEVAACRTLKRICDSASEFVARKCLGEKIDVPPIRGIKPHPLTFLLLNSLLRGFEMTDSSPLQTDCLMYTARVLALNLWHVENADVKPALVGLGTKQDLQEEEEPPYTTLSAQCNAAEICKQMQASLFALANRLSSNQQHRNGLEECALAWGAGLKFFYPSATERSKVFNELIARKGSESDFLLESLCGKLAMYLPFAKSLTLESTVDGLMDSIQRTLGDRPQQQQQQASVVVSFRSPTQAAVIEPLSPASSTGGASVFSIVSNRKRGDGDDDDDQEEMDFEMGSVSGQTRARSVGTASVASSLIAVAEESSSQADNDGEHLPILISADSSQSMVTRQRSLKLAAQQQRSIIVDAVSSSLPEVIRPSFLRHYQRTRLLWVLQGMLMVRSTPSSSSNASPSPSLLAFDEPRCAETIQVLMDGKKAVQKADKKWGTAISSQAMNASLGEGVFRWRIRVDKCEDGHVFFGVATREATSSTYLGEDANGWGFIGKAHLWHNREKKGSYGESIRTGDVVTVTLDCKRGTLSYANASKDFGVAFRGLKEHCTGDAFLYPAVALYEKGDTVTLLPALAVGDDPNALESGVCRGLYWNFLDGAQSLERCLSLANRSLASLMFSPPEDYVRHVEAVLARFPTLPSTTFESASMHLLSTLSAFALWPNSRIMTKVAVRLLPTALKALEWCTSTSSSSSSSSSSIDLSGKWWFHDSQTSKHLLDLAHDVNTGTVRGTLQSKREGMVKVVGSLRGTSLCLAEYWKSAVRFVKVTFMPDARVAVGWHQAESKFSNQQTTQQQQHPIKPMYALRASLRSPSKTSSSSSTSTAVMILSTLVGKLCFALTCGSGLESTCSSSEDDSSSPERKWASSELFLHQKSDQGAALLLQRLEEEPTLRDLVLVDDVVLSIGQEEEEEENPSSSSEDDEEFIHRFIDGECADLDHWLLRFAGQAALVAKGGPVMARVRRSAICCFLLHSAVTTEARLIDRYFAMKTNRGASASVDTEENSVDEELDKRGAPHPSVMLINIWRASTRVVGWAIREKQTTNVSYEVVSEPLLAKAQLLLATKPHFSLRPRLDYPDAGGGATTSSKEEDVALKQLEEWKKRARARTRTLARTQPESTEPLVLFLMDRDLQPERLRDVFAQRAWKAIVRCAGFNACTLALQALMTAQAEERGAVSCLVQWLSSTTTGPLDSDPNNGMAELSQHQPTTSSQQQQQVPPTISALDFDDMGLTATQSSSSSFVFKSNDKSHCLHGLDGCGTWPATLVRRAFENLYTKLAGILTSSSSCEEDDDLIAVLDLWNFPLKSKEDYDFLLRVELLQNVKKVLDAAARKKREDDDELPASLRLRSKSKTAVLNASLRLLGGLAHQIVTDLSLTTTTTTKSQHTLTQLIYSMAFEELATACDRFSSNNLDEEDNLYQLLQLLFSVSVTGPLISRTYLCENMEWIQLLLRVSSNASSSLRLQQRALRLLGRILPFYVLPAGDDDSTGELVVIDLLAQVRQAFPSSLPSTLNGFTLAVRSAAASESIVLLRKLLSAKTSWARITKRILHASVVDGEDDCKTWASLCVFGGFYDPLRMLGLVRFVSLEDVTTTTTARGVVIGVQDQKVHVVIPGMMGAVPAIAAAVGATNEDQEMNAEEERGLKVLPSHNKKTKTMTLAAVVCDKSEVVPVSECAVAHDMLSDDGVHEALTALFDRHILFTGDISSMTATTLDKRVSQAVVRSALAKMTPILMMSEEEEENFVDSSRFAKLVKLAVHGTDTMGLSDIHAVTSWWRALTEAWFERQRSSSSPTTTDFAVVKEQEQEQQPPLQESPALSEMVSLDLGFPRELCAIALERCGNDVEAAIHFCLEHAADSENLIEEYRWSRLARSSSSAAATATATGGGQAAVASSSGESRRSEMVVEKLKEMGFPHTWCVKALDAVQHEGFNQALTWILANGDALQEQDEAAEKALHGAPAPPLVVQSETKTEPQQEDLPPPRLVCTSGGQVSTHITPDNGVFVKPAVGLGGFPSVVAKGLLLTRGKWYYELVLESENCMQVGWADATFTGDSFEGTGVGDDTHSWAYDGYRKLKWHQTSQPWGKQWKTGDCVGCGVDLDAGEIWFSLNGVWEEGMGLAFKGLVRDLNYLGGLTPAASFNRTEKMRFNFGPKFKHTGGWSENARPVCEAFDDAEVNAKHVRNHRISASSSMSSSRAVLLKCFASVDDCFEESVGDALSDRYFSSGQFASTSLLARRSSSGASGPSVASSNAHGSSSSTSTNAFHVKDPFPKACSLSGIPSTALQAQDELNRVEKTPAGDERIAKAIEACCETLVVLHTRAACLCLLLNWSNLRESTREAVHRSLNNTEDADVLWTLVKTCAGKVKVTDVFNAVDNSCAAPASAQSTHVDALSALALVARDLILGSRGLTESLYAVMVKELSLGASRMYANVPWDDFDLANPAVVHYLWGITMDDQSHPLSEVRVLQHPNVRFACWATDVLRSPQPMLLLEDDNDDKRLVHAWALALRSPGTRMKIVCSRMLLSFILDDPDTDARFHEWVQDAIDPIRIRDVAGRLLSRSGTVSMHAVPSKYSLAMSELAAAVSEVAQHDDDEV